MKNAVKTGLVGLLAAGLALLGSVAPANAADTIDPNRAVTLNIYKYAGDPTDNVDPQTGAPIGATPLPGVTFTLQRLSNVDLTSNAGWATLSGVTAAALADGDPANDNGVTLAAGPSIVTNGQGLATASSPDIQVGAYLVTETQFGSYTVAPPFLVTLPHEAANGTWDYVQNVYPKNQDVRPTKSVDAANATIGSNLTFTIDAPVPAGELTRFIVRDPLEASLQGVPGSVVVTADGVDLVPSDYTITESNPVQVEFTEAGRAKLQAARAGNPALKAHVVLQAEILSIPASGVIANTATVLGPNGLELDTDADINGQETPTSVTFAPLTITKTGDGGNSELNGATFELYVCAANPDGGYALSGDALTMSTTPTGGQATTITTANGADGGQAATAQGYGIPVTTFATDATAAEATQYCVLETNAPANFVRNPEPQPVTYTAGAAGQAGTLSVSVLNQRNTILGQLPATGAWGLGLILLVGLALIARGIWTSRRDDRRARQA